MVLFNVRHVMSNLDITCLRVAAVGRASMAIVLGTAIAARSCLRAVFPAINLSETFGVKLAQITMSYQGDFAVR